MPKSHLKRFFLATLSFMRLLMVAWMVGIANSIKQEAHFMDDTNYKIEWRDEQADDQPFEEL